MALIMSPNVGGGARARKFELAAADKLLSAEVLIKWPRAARSQLPCRIYRARAFFFCFHSSFSWGLIFLGFGRKSVENYFGIEGILGGTMPEWPFSIGVFFSRVAMYNMVFEVIKIIKIELFRVSL